MPIQPLRVALYQGPGANPDLLNAYLQSHAFDVHQIMPDFLPELAQSTTDVLYLPGGWYQFCPSHVEAIRRFASHGGGVVATCAGAYLVIGSLGLIPGKSLRSNMRGRLYLEPKQGDHPILRGIAQKCTRHNDRAWEQLPVAHMGGPIMLLQNPDHLIAAYDFEHQLAAVAAAEFSAGRVVAIASHPECTLPAFSPDDPARNILGPTDQASRLIANAVRWAART